ncbi:MAG: zf-HC2 domain-containing protein [Planctomycetes bacterium]|nr:zf-HC2 domain-containing protein [Planctomycetota bacterium]
MSCEKFEVRLQELLDERLRPEDDAQLGRHADACPACRGVLTAQAALWDGLAGRPAPRTSAGFVEAVVANAECGAGGNAECGVRNAEWEERGRRRTAVGWLVAAAVVVAVAPAAYWSIRSGATRKTAAERESVAPQAPTSPQIAEHRAPPPEVATIDDGDPGSAPIPSSLTPEERYALLLERWQSQLPELGGRLGLIGEDAPATQGAAAVSQITDRIRTPLSSSLISTLNVLRTALPTGADPSPAKPQARRAGAVSERTA